MREKRKNDKTAKEIFLRKLASHDCDINDRQPCSGEILSRASVANFGPLAPNRYHGFWNSHYVDSILANG